MKQGILFDFNGTMFWDSPKHKEAWNVFSLKYRGKGISDDEMDHMHGQTNQRIIQMLLGDMSEEESTQLSKDKEALYRECCIQDAEGFHLMPGLIALLNELKQKQMPMTICTASIWDNVEFFISSFHLDRWFTIGDIVYDDGSYENKIAMFHEGAKRIGVPIEQCIVFEDSLSGIEFARQCHVNKIIAVTQQEKVQEMKMRNGVDLVICDFHEIDMTKL